MRNVPPSHPLLGDLHGSFVFNSSRRHSKNKNGNRRRLSPTRKQKRQIRAKSAVGSSRGWFARPLVNLLLLSPSTRGHTRLLSSGRRKKIWKSCLLRFWESSRFGGWIFFVFRGCVFQRAGSFCRMVLVWFCRELYVVLNSQWEFLVDLHDWVMMALNVVIDRVDR